MTALQQLKNNKDWVLIAFLVIFHTVGVFGMTSDYRETFLSLSFTNLIVSFLILMLARKQHSIKFYGYLLFIFIVGMGVELIGTKTGYLFGEYSYGKNLGFKFYGVPLIIGINWAVLTICSCSIAHYLNVNNFIKAIVSSALMTGLDFLIEPVAITSDYWTWEGEIPLFNYVCWFLISFLLHLLFFKLKLAEKNKVAVALFVILAIFFIVLN